MEELIDAIGAAKAANSTLTTSLSGGMFFGRAEQGASYPYGVCFINTVTPTVYFPASDVTKRGEEYLIQFNIWDDDDSRQVITGIEDDMRAVYDYGSLTITNHTHIATIPMEAHILRDPEKRWQLSMDYRIRVRRTS
jgi:hypothetical protein